MIVTIVTRYRFPAYSHENRVTMASFSIVTPSSHRHPHRHYPHADSDAIAAYVDNVRPAVVSLVAVAVSFERYHYDRTRLVVMHVKHLPPQEGVIPKGSFTNDS